MTLYRGRHRVVPALPRILVSAGIAVVILVTAAYLLPALARRVLDSPLLLASTASAAAVLITGCLLWRARTGSALAGYAAEVVSPVAALALVLAPLAQAAVVQDQQGSVVASDPGRQSGASGDGTQSSWFGGPGGYGPGAPTTGSRADASRHGRDARRTGVPTPTATAEPRSGERTGGSGDGAAGSGAGTRSGTPTTRSTGDGSHPSSPTPAPTVLTPSDPPDGSGKPTDGSDPSPTVDSKSPRTATPTAPSPESEVIAHGYLIGLGTSIIGTVRLVSYSDGTQEIVIGSDFSAQSLEGDIEVYLTPGLNRYAPGGILLGSLQALEGGQSYPVSKPVEPGTLITLLLVPASGLVPVGLAVLRP